MVSSWVDFTNVREMNALFGSLQALLPDRPSSGPQVPPLASLEACRTEMNQAGFRDVVVIEHAARASYPSTPALIDSMVRTSAPIAVMRKNLGDRWPALQAAWTERVEQLGEGPHAHDLRAYLSVGTR